MDIKTTSANETKKVATNLAKKFLNGGVIALIGEMGAGKTTFVQGFAKGLGIKDKIISPTFVLMRQHQVPNSDLVLYHIDLYRLEGKINIEELGISDLFDDAKAIVLIEWAEKIKDLLPIDTTQIKITSLDKTSRQIMISSPEETL